MREWRRGCGEEGEEMREWGGGCGEEGVEMRMWRLGCGRRVRLGEAERAAAYSLARPIDMAPSASILS
jgi:hypothetical protein